MKKFLVLFSLLLVAGLPNMGSATPVTYSVSGSLWSEDEHAWKDGLLSGHVEIDDEVIVADSGMIYAFHVLGYEIFAEGNLITGDVGMLHLENIHNTIERGLSDWVLGPYTGGGQYDFQGFFIDFKNEDGTPYDTNNPESWQTLAPLITLSCGELFYWEGGQWPSRTGARLTLNKMSPVPEPSTMILLSAGIVGLAAFRKRFKLNTRE